MKCILNYPEPGKVTLLRDVQQVLTHVHEASDDCFDNGCAIHSPSQHHMRDWQLWWRSRTGPFEIGLPIMERICPHGIGHPDPDHIAFLRRTKGDTVADAEAVHGCDGCCVPHKLGCSHWAGKECICPRGFTTKPPNQQ